MSSCSLSYEVGVLSLLVSILWLRFCSCKHKEGGSKNVYQMEYVVVITDAVRCNYFLVVSCSLYAAYGAK